jgi:predicted nucleotidyltransferase
MVYMRITDTEKNAILSAVEEVDRHAEIWLFGSRVDDTKRGGDIDVAIRSAAIDRLQKMRIRRSITDVLGDQKIDLVVSSGGREPFFRLAIENGVRLNARRN